MRAEVVCIVILPVVAGCKHTAGSQVQPAVAFKVKRAYFIAALRHINHSAGVYRLLKRGGIKRFAVALCAVIHYISHIILLLSVLCFYYIAPLVFML